MTPARGEVWRYLPVMPRVGQADLRLIVSADGINQVKELPAVLAVNVVESDPGGLLAVAVDPHGWATAMTVAPVLRSRLAECVGTVPAATMEHVSAALRAAQDL